ncbi:MAG: alpha/beta hydrolase [Candidatus Eremiobacteraeota bacterium]|nr:alpha/beta hydrolase [Candidatus Eremiobacteraeota bacterium]
MASFQAGIARWVARVTTKREVRNALGKPDFVRRYRTTLNRMRLTFGRLPRGAQALAVDENGIRGEWVLGDAAASTVVLYNHGGGYVALSPPPYRSLTGALALKCGARVFALDYRLAPEHPYPAAVDDAIAAYDWLLAQGIAPQNVVVGGDSAGGGLTLSLLLALRRRGRPLPACAFLFSPWVDLTGTSDSVRTNAESDDVLVHDGSDRFARMYAGDRALDDPDVSGLFADLSGLPPLLVQASTIEMLRDDAVRLVERAGAAGVDARLHLYDGLPHVWQLFANLPESREALAQIAQFVAANAGLPNPGARPTLR